MAIWTLSSMGEGIVGYSHQSPERPYLHTTRTFGARLVFPLRIGLILLLLWALARILPLYFPFRLSLTPYPN
jgi:hypothetical protein